jgi:DNA-binding NtrC family response regulator
MVDTPETTFLPARGERPQAAESAATLRLVFSPFLGLRAALREPVSLSVGLRIGRSVEGKNALSLPDPSLSRVHAEVVEQAGRLAIRDLSSHGSVLNGKPIDGTAALDNGDVLRLGDSCFVVRTKPLAVEAPADAVLNNIVGVSPAMRKVRATIALMASTPSSVLVLGPSGSGKELCVAALHRQSGRTGALVPINSAAIPEQLVESELFGHAAGAFTGAKAASLGAFRAADGGTLFLDEVGELSASAQAKLLRAIETREISPVGSATRTRVDVRMVAATHRDLVADARAGRFRTDLYARLAELVVRVPPLVDRREDVLLLLAHFLDAAGCPAEQCGTKVDGHFAEQLLLHSWPLNVREVRRVAATLALHANQPWSVDVVADALAEGRRLAGEDKPTPADADEDARGGERGSPPDREALEALLVTHQGNVAQLAQAVGRSRKQVYRWLTQHQIDPEAFRR